MIDLQERSFLGVQFLCRTESRGGGEGCTAVVKLQLEIDEDLQNVFCVWPKLRQACRRQPRCPLHRCPLTASSVQPSLHSI